jgi:hypothetical protein
MRCSSGSVAVEFALIAPVLIGAVLMMADIGLEIHESFKMDHIVRNGAQAALTDPGKSAVCSVLEPLDPGGGQCDREWIVDRRRFCPETPSQRALENATCANSRPTAIVYQISGTRTFSGILLPARNITRTTSVQVR